jgi:hypothetical protein
VHQDQLLYQEGLHKRWLWNRAEELCISFLFLSETAHAGEKTSCKDVFQETLRKNLKNAIAVQFAALLCLNNCHQKQNHQPAY